MRLESTKILITACVLTIIYTNFYIPPTKRILEKVTLKNWGG